MMGADAKGVVAIQDVTTFYARMIWECSNGAYDETISQMIAAVHKAKLEALTDIKIVGG